MNNTGARHCTLTNVSLRTLNRSCIASHSHSQTLTHHIILFLFFLFSFLRAHIHMAHFLHGNLLIFRYVCGTVARSNSKHNQFINAWGSLEFYIIFFFLSFFRQTFQWIVRCFALFFGYQSNFIYIYFWLNFDLFSLYLTFSNNH